jgi:hypothetical protein
VWTTTNSGVTLYDGFNPTATGASDQRFLLGMTQRLRQIPNEADRSDYLAREARTFARDLPERAVKLGLIKIARTWSPVPLSKDGSGNALLTWVSAIYSVPLFALTLVGIFMPKLSRQAKVYLLCPAIYLTAIHALSVGSIRYRLPGDVPMAVMAASVVARKPSSAIPNATSPDKP